MEDEEREREREAEEKRKITEEERVNGRLRQWRRRGCRCRSYIQRKDLVTEKLVIRLSDEIICVLKTFFERNSHISREKNRSLIKIYITYCNAIVFIS